MPTAFAGRLFVVFALMLCAHPARSTAAADEPLRWTLQPDERLHWLVVKETKASAPNHPATNITVVERMDITWHVVEVDEAGNAQIELTFGHIHTTMTSALGEIEYDSQEEPVGLAALAGPGLKVLTEHPFRFTLSPRGEIRDLVIPNEVMEALKNGPSVEALGEMLSEDGFRQMLLQTVVPLPEGPLEEGQSWSQTAEIDNPQFGKQAIDTTYRYEGQREADGATLAVIVPSVKVTFAEEGATVPVEISEQTSAGELLFDPTSGRLHSSRVEHGLVLQLGIGDETIEQRIDQVISVDVQPAPQQPPDEPQEPDTPSEPGDDSPADETL